MVLVLNLGTSVTKCSECNGTGRVTQVQNTILGQMQTTRTCSTCHGTGEVIKEPCETCKGRGKVRKQPKITIKIPAGIDNGQNMVLKGEGEPGEKGGPNGNLNVYIRLKRNSIFTREGKNVMCDVPITITQATLGANLEIPLVDGKKETYKIPEGTQNGTKFVLKGKGFKGVHSSSVGDLIFTTYVQIPKHLNKEQRELFTKLAKTMNEQPPVKKRGFFDW